MGYSTSKCPPLRLVFLTFRCPLRFNFQSLHPNPQPRPSTQMKRPAPPESFRKTNDNPDSFSKGGRNGEEIWWERRIPFKIRKNTCCCRKKNSSFSMLCPFLFISNFVMMTQQFFGPLYKIHGRFGDLGLKVKIHS